MNITETEEFKREVERLEKEHVKHFASKIAKQQIDTDELIATKQIETEKQEQLADCKIRRDEFVLKQQIARLSNEQKLSNEKDAYVRNMGRIKVKSLLSYSSPLLFAMSIVFAVISTLMSMASISHLHGPEELLTIMHTKYWIPAVLMAMIQATAILLSALSYGIKTYYKSMSYCVTAIRMIVLVVSVYTNHDFLVSIISEYEYNSGIYTGWFFAAFADILSMFTSAWATRLKHRLYDNDVLLEDEQVGYFQKIVSNIMSPHLEKIDIKYAENKARKINRINGNQDFYKNPTFNSKTNKNVDAVNTVNTSVYEPKVPDRVDFYREKILAFEADEKITRHMLSLDEKTWRQIRDYFVKEGLLYCRGKSTFRATCKAS